MGSWAWTQSSAWNSFQPVPTLAWLTTLLQIPARASFPPGKPGPQPDDFTESCSRLQSICLVVLFRIIPIQSWVWWCTPVIPAIAAKQDCQSLEANSYINVPSKCPFLYFLLKLYEESWACPKAFLCINLSFQTCAPWPWTKCAQKCVCHLLQILH
jgi:hypothetical protein